MKYKDKKGYEHTKESLIDFIGIEMDENYFKIGQERLK